MLTRDPRHYQIAVLGLLLAWGVLALGFPVRPETIALLVGSALATQAVLGWIFGVHFDYRSPLISSLSLCLLARAASPTLLALTAVAAIGSKFLIRHRGKHVFNPTNFGLASMALLSGGVWISPGQWGSGATLGFLLACAGGLVVHRAARSDVTWAFLASYSALLFGRAAWLGDPWAVPLHSLDSGALLIFAFFMISDPKTTPDSRWGRIAYAALVAVGAALFHFGLHRPNGFIWSLVCAAPFVPVIDYLLPGRRYRWAGARRRRPPWGDGRYQGEEERHVARATTPLAAMEESRMYRFVAHPPKTPATGAGATEEGRRTAGAGASRRFLPHPPKTPATGAGATEEHGVSRRRPARLGARAIGVALVALLSLAAAGPASAFCGFYVAKADAKLFNQASQVVLVRDDGKTVLTMANDFRGDPQEFAIVIPVPTFLERDQIHVADQALIDHLDAYTAPRLVEYFDPDPCQRVWEDRERMATQSVGAGKRSDADLPSALGVTIEAKYTVGEYDILILSAEESRGLETWLTDNGYRLPPGASRVLGSYLRQGMRFFVAKVNLDERERLGFSNLRPLQVAFETPKFMLPIRLGTVNADGPQELFVYTLTRKGRVETTNYRTQKLPTGMDIPVFVKDDFGSFYRDLFSTQVERDGMRSIYLEYAWDMAWCDPCAADPLSPEELRELGVFWLDGTSSRGQARNVFVTRLHVRYDGERFPDDLRFQETADRSNFQGRYVLRHAFRGTATCQAAGEYRRGLGARFEREAQTLATLTGWDIEGIRDRIGWDGPVEASDDPWWKKIWDRGR